MTDPLREQILSLPPSPNASLLTETQRLFAFLSSSARDACAAKGFYKMLPDWYRSGIQQDSCEFGKYVLDQLDTHLKGISTPISAVFEGRLLQVITCVECRNPSFRVETFHDLSLAFVGDAQKAGFIIIQALLCSES